MRLTGIASFCAGTHNGVPYTPESLRAIARNFALYSAGAAPHYSPFVSINHDDGLACGLLTGCRFDGSDGRLHLDADRVPESVVGLVKSRRLTAPSVELFLPRVTAGGKLDGFRGPKDEVVGTPVLRALTLLGNKPPAVKGLPPLSAAVASFAHDFGKSFNLARQLARFGKSGVASFDGDFAPMDPATMDRAALTAALAAAGFDAAKLDPATPDDTLREMLRVLQAANPAAAAMPANPADPNAPAQFSHADLRRLINSEVAAKLKPQADRLKAQKIAAFRDEMTGARNGRACMTPAQFDAFAQTALDLDDESVAKFSHDDKAHGTKLDAAIDRTRKAHGSATVKVFGAQVQTSTPGAAGGGQGGAAGGIGPTRRAGLLAGTSNGKAILKREQDAAK